jgi:hypothetical protein
LAKRRHIRWQRPVWRSGIGVDRNALIYAAGDGLSAYSLARILARAGAIRAMELDLNESWMTFDYFKPDARSPWGWTPPRC